MRKPATLCALLTVLASPAAAARGAGLPGTQWKAYRILGHAVPKRFRADIEFGKRTVKGHAWCNSFFGHYSVAPGFGLRFGSIRTTAVGCGGIAHPPDFYGALQRTRTYTQAGGRLTLRSAQGEVLVRLRRVAG